MRTTLDLPDELMNDALRLSRLPTKREAVIAGLRELVRKAHREELLASAGKVELRLDPVRSRKSRR